jgi:hypothetical protein
MSWPRKGDGYRLYKESGPGYILLCPVDEFAVANYRESISPELCGIPSPHDTYLKTNCRRVAWCDLPKEWQTAFLQYMRTGSNGQDVGDWFVPEKVRGLWRIGEQPAVSA